MELYEGANTVDDKYEKTNAAGSIDREFTVDGAEAWPHSFSISALYRGEWSTSHFHHFTPGKQPSTHQRGTGLDVLENRNISCL
jgi:hypothetical protein